MTTSPTPSPSTPAPVVEIVEAWYGTFALHTDYGGQVPQRIRETQQLSASDGRFFIPGDMNSFFGFDPCPGEIKTVAAHVRIDGKEYYLQGREHQPMDFVPSRDTPKVPYAPPTITIVEAWYGSEAKHSDKGGIVSQKLREVIARSGEGRLSVPADMNAFFGYDPCAGVAKQLYVFLRLSTGEEHRLRAPEGRRFYWSPTGF